MHWDRRLVWVRWATLREQGIEGREERESSIEVNLDLVGHGITSEVETTSVFTADDHVPQNIGIERLSRDRRGPFGNGMPRYSR